MGYFDDLLPEDQGQGNFKKPYVKERGFIGDTASGLGRGVLGLAELGASAYETITGSEVGLDEWAEKTRENVDFFKQDRSEYFGKDGFVKRGWQSAMESLVPSISGAAPGAVVGGTLGATFGGVGAIPGAAIGAVLSTLGLFGAGTYGQAKEEALSQGLSEEDATDYAWKQGAIEGGIESVATGAEFMTAGLGKFFTRPLASSLKQMLRTSSKDVTKAYLKTAGVETTTEMLQSGLGASVDQQYGIEGAGIAESMVDSIMPSIFMSGIFTIGGQGYTARQKALLRNDLQSGDPVRQTRASQALYENIKQSDVELADSFRRFATERIGQENSFDINLTLTEIMGEVEENQRTRKVDPLTDDIASLESIIDQRLKRTTPVPYDEAELTDEAVASFEQQSLRYRQRTPETKAKQDGVPDLTDEYRQLGEEVTTAKPGQQEPVEEISDEDAKLFEEVSLAIRKAALGKTPENPLDLTGEYQGILTEETAKGKTADPSRDQAERVLQETQQDQFDSERYKQLVKQKTATPEERQELLSEDVRERTADLLAEENNLSPEDTTVLKSALRKEVYGVPLSESEASLLDTVRETDGTTDTIITPETPQEAYVSPEDTQVLDEEQMMRRGQPEAPEVAYTEDGQPVPTVASPEDVLIAGEEVQTETEATTDTIVSPRTQDFLEKNSSKIAKEAIAESKSRGKGQGKAKVFDEWADGVQKELREAGEEWRFTDEDRKELKAIVTYASSSRKSTKATKSGLTWGEPVETTTGQVMKTATDSEGRNYIIDGDSLTLTYETSKGQWETVEGTSVEDLTNKASEVVSGKTTSVTTLSDVSTPNDQSSKPMSTTVKERLDSGARLTDASTLLKELKDTDNSTVKATVDLLNRIAPEEKLKTLQVVPADLFTGDPKVAEDMKGTSFYDVADHTFYYAPNASDRTIAHEIIHGVTAREFQERAKINSKDPLVKELRNLRKEYESHLAERGDVTSREQYATSNTLEFLSMAMTEPEIQESLKTIVAPKSQRTSTIRSLWDKLVDTVRKAFGLPTEYTSALEEVISITSELANMELSEVAIENPQVAEMMAAGLTRSDAERMAKEFLGDYSPEAAASLKEAKDFITKATIAEQEEKQWFMGPLKKAISSIDKFIQPVMEEVRKISPRVASLLLKMELDINLKNKKYHDKIKGFINKYNKLNDSDKKILDLYLMNVNNQEDSKVLDEILREKGMTEEWKEVQSVLDDVYSRYEKVGLNLFNRIDRYFPRRVDDPKGFMAYLRKQKAKKEGIDIEPGTGIFDEVLEDPNMSEKEKEDAIAQIVNTGYNPSTALKIPTSAKSRSIQRVKASMMKYYMNPMDSLIDTIYEANEAIETRKLVGVTARKKLTDQVNRRYDKLQRAKTPGAKEKLTQEINALTSQIRDIEAVSDDSISKFLQENGQNLTEDQQADLTAALRSRLNQKGMRGATARLRDIGLITALGSPLNAITQLGDLVWSMYDNGIPNTIAALYGKKEVTTEDLDMSHVLKEFSQGSSAKWLDRTLKWTGFQFMDQFGKTVNMQAAINKARKTDKDTFVKKWSEALTPETAEKVWEDIQAKNTTDAVKHFVFSAVSKFQPVSLSEMPQMYLQSGNGRIFYTLKSYGIKALSNVRREIIENFQKGDTKAGIKGLTTLLPLLVLGNASVDELKDWILGRDDAFSDQVWDNLLKLGFASRYTVDKGFRSGSPVATFFKDVLTPPGIGVADPFLKDFYNLVSDPENPTYKSLSVIPFAGKLAYSRTPEGKTKESDKQRKRLYTKVRESVSEGNYNSVRKEINDFNRKQRKIGGKIIDNKTIRSLKSKERKKLRDSNDGNT